LWWFTWDGKWWTKIVGLVDGKERRDGDVVERKW
jgi:hypothetical protein